MMHENNPVIQAMKAAKSNKLQNYKVSLYNECLTTIQAKSEEEAICIAAHMYGLEVDVEVIDDVY